MGFHNLMPGFSADASLEESLQSIIMWDTPVQLHNIFIRLTFGLFVFPFLKFIM